MIANRRRAFSIVFIITGMLLSGTEPNAQICLDQPVSLRPVIRLPDAIRESSGLVAVGLNVLWSHNDAGNANKLYCFDTTGTMVRTLEIANVANVDWEDLACDDQGNIYIDDAGNNDNDRTDLAIHIIPNPLTIAGDETFAETIHFTFEDQTAFPPPSSNRNFDIEALVWRSDSLLLFTKNRSIPLNGYCKQYILPAHAGVWVARLVDSVYLGPTNDEARVTAAAIHPTNGELVLLTLQKLVKFSGYPGNEVFKGEMNVYPFTLPPGQVEAADYTGSNRLYVTGEGSGGNSGFLYDVFLPFNTGTDFLPPAEGKLRLKVTGDRLILDTDKGTVDFDEIDLFDAKGNLIEKASNTHILNISRIPAGFYVVFCSKDGRKRSAGYMKSH